MLLGDPSNHSPTLTRLIQPISYRDPLAPTNRLPRSLHSKRLWGGSNPCTPCYKSVTVDHFGKFPWDDESLERVDFQLRLVFPWIVNLFLVIRVQGRLLLSRTGCRRTWQEGNNTGRSVVSLFPGHLQPPMSCA